MVQKEKKRRNIPGILLLLVQFICSAVFLIFTYKSRFVPMKYMIVLMIVMLLLLAVILILQLKKKKTSIAGCIVSVGIGIACCVGAYFMHDVTASVQAIGGSDYKTDNMIVVVQKEDPAKQISDAKDYVFGVQTKTDQENTDKMVKKLTTIFGKEPEVKEYDTPQDVVRALMEGEVDAGIYNEAFVSLFSDDFQNYSDLTKVLYQYGIDTILESTKQTVSKPFNVYISGIDVYGPISTNSRSDVNIIATINPQTKQVLLTTTPRDYYLTFPGVTGEQKDKLTHAGIYGVDVSMATLEQLYQTEINYYVRVNFTSLIKLIDTMGGVNVNSEYAFEAGGFSFQKGVNHMNGEQALAFSRERHSFAEGDNQRGKNQEEVIRGIIKKMLQPSMLAKAPDILEKLKDSLQTNIPDEEISALIQTQLSDRASWEVLTESAEGAGLSRTCYSTGDAYLYVMEPDETSVDRITEQIRKMLNGEKVTETPNT